MAEEQQTEHEKVTAGLVARLAILVGEAMSIEMFDYGYRIAPHNPRALKLWISTEPGLIIEAGHNGGHWELDYDNENDLLFAWMVMSAVVAGRVQERFGRGRSRVTITLEDGSTRSETGFDGLISLLPQPGWKSRGRLVQYEPYV
jgi:hypothetical protein